jgi:hypothetical protein
MHKSLADQIGAPSLHPISLQASFCAFQDATVYVCIVCSSDLFGGPFRWDEEKFGFEYDLDLFNIVAVDDFNMGVRF